MSLLSSRNTPATPLHPRRRRALGVYDGFIANVGRVVVESTWHHFLDINLIGDPIAPGAKKLGFLASPDGQAVLAGIERLYRNIIYWLSPQLMALHHLTAAVVRAMHLQPLAEVLSSSGGSAAPAAIGEVAAGTLRRVAGSGMLISWAQYVLPQPIREALPALPWGPVTGTSGCGSVDHRQVMHAALGGAVLAANEMRRRASRRLNPDDKETQQTVLHGALAGIRSLAPELERNAEGMARFARAIRNSEPVRH